MPPPSMQRVVLGVGIILSGSTLGFCVHFELSNKSQLVAADVAEEINALRDRRARMC